jgi:hypothetical protein
MSKHTSSKSLSYLLKFLGFVWGLLRFCVTVVSVTLATLLLLLYQPPPALKRLLIAIAEEQTQAFTGLPLRLAAISDLSLRPSQQRLTLENIRVYGYRGAPQPFLVLPRLSLEMDIFNYLLERSSQNQLILSHPRINILRDQSGRLNIRPRLKPGEEKPKEPPGPHPYLPSFLARIENSQWTYQDQDAKYPLRTQFQMPLIEALIVDQDHLDFSARLRSALSNLDTQGRLNIWTGQTRLQAELNNPNLHTVASYAARVPELNVLSGALAVKALAEWDDYQLKNLSYRGRLNADHLRAKVPMYRLPLELSTETLFSQDKLDVLTMSLSSPGHSLSLQGQLLHYLQPAKMYLEAALNISRLDLAELSSAVEHPAITSFRALHPSGSLSSKLQLKGLISALEIAGEVSIPHARVRDIDIHQGFTRFVYGSDHVSVPLLQAGVFAGQISGEAFLNLGKNPYLQTAQVHAQRISLDQIQKTFGLSLPADYKPAGLVNLDAQAKGPLSDPHAQGRLSSALLDFPNSKKLGHIQNLLLDFDYQQALTRATLQARSADAGNLKMGLLLKSMDGLDLWLDTENLPLETVNKWSPVNYFESGQAHLSASVKGSLREMQKDWQAFSGQGSLQGQNLILTYPLNQGEAPVRQPLESLDFELDWQRGQAHLTELVLAEGKTHLEGAGSVSVPGLARSDWSGVLQAHLDGKIDGQDLPILKNYQIDKGLVQLDIDAQGGPKRDVQVALKTEGRDLSAKGIDLQFLSLDLKYASKKVDIYQAHLKQDEEQLDLKGQIDLNTTSPTMDLMAQAYRFDLKTLFSLLPPETRAPFETRKTKLETPPADPVPIIYGLPKARMHVFAPHLGESKDKQQQSISLDEFLVEYWERWSYPPAPRLEQKTVEKPKSLAETLAGKLSVDMKVTGTVAEPQVALKALLQDAQIQNSQIAESYLQAQYGDRQVKIERAYLQEPGGGILRANGELDLDKEMQLELQGQGISLKLADPFLKGQGTRLEGNLDFLAVATGSLKNPELSAQMTVDRLLMNQFYFDRLDTISGYNNGYLKDLRVELKSGNQEIVVFGDFPVSDLGKPVDLSLSLKDESFGLINLFTGALDWRSGKGSVLVRLVGTPRKPELEGTLSINNATVYIPSLKEIMTEIDIKGEVFTNKVDLAYLRGKVAGGNLEVKGNMDLLNLLPSFLNLEANGQNLLIRYNMPGLLTTQTAVKDAKIRIKGLINQPVISGNVTLGKNGETTFPFLKDQQDLPTSSEIKSESGEVKPARYLFGGLKVAIPDEYSLHSPIFDIPVYSDKGLNLRHWGGNLTITGDILAKKGTLYLFNNALKIDKMVVDFPKVRTTVAGQDTGLNPDLQIETSFNVKGADQAVKATIKGKLSDLKNNELLFDFSNKQGLTDTQIFNQIFGGEAVSDLSQGNVTGLASKFSDVFLRGLFSPLTSKLSELLGLEELSFGIVGQSVSGPIFNFKIRSNPFFLVEDLIEERLQQLSFINRLRVSGEGTLGDQAIYKLGANYSLGENWALDYQFTSNEQLHKVTVKGSYALPAILNWLGYWRDRFNGKLEDVSVADPGPQASPTPSSASKL